LFVHVWSTSVGFNVVRLLLSPRCVFGCEHSDLVNHGWLWRY